MVRRPTAVLLVRGVLNQDLDRIDDHDTDECRKHLKKLKAKIPSQIQRNGYYKQKNCSIESCFRETFARTLDDRYKLDGLGRWIGKFVRRIKSPVLDPILRSSRQCLHMNLLSYLHHTFQIRKVSPRDIHQCHPSSFHFESRPNRTKTSRGPPTFQRNKYVQSMRKSLDGSFIYARTE